MEHQEYQTKLYDYYDGELNKEESLDFSNHLHNCSQCQEQLDRLKKLSEALLKESDIDCSAQFSKRIMKKIEGKESALLNWFGLPKWEVVLACSVSIFIFSYFSVEYLRSAPKQDWGWLFSNREINKEDLLQMTLGGDHANNEELEGFLYE